MNLQKILKNRRGVALENALLFMLVIFSLCALLTSLTLIGHFQTRINKLTLENEVDLEQIGEDFVASVKAGEAFDEEAYTNYACSTRTLPEENRYFLSVGHKNDTQQVLLYVEVEKDGNAVTVVQWRYSFPQ